MRFKYFSAAATEVNFLEMELNLRLNLALIADKFDIPFVYTPLSGNVGLGQSEYALRALDQKWAEYFSLITDKFYHISALEIDRVDFFDVKYGISNGLLNLNPTRDSFVIESQVARKVKASYWPFPFSMKSNVIPATTIRDFIKKSHSAYVESFVSEKREPFENNTLRVGILIENNRQRIRFFMEKLLGLLDFFESCAHITGSDLEIHLFLDLVGEDELPNDLRREKSEKLAALSSRSYVTWHKNPSFESIVNGIGSSDISFTTETEYCRYVYGSFLTLLSNPKQIRVEIDGGLNQLALNNCFLMWEGKNLIFEKEKMRNMLKVAKEGVSDQAWQGKSLFKPLGKQWLFTKKKQINVTSGVIDGLGSYFLKVFEMQIVSDYYGLSYIYIPPVYFDHAVFDSTGEHMQSDIFTLGEGYPTFEEIFGEGVEDIHFFRLMPPLSKLQALNLSLGELVVSKIVRFRNWPVQKSYLSQRIVKISESFRHKYKDYKDSFEDGVLNVALHFRSFYSDIDSPDYARLISFESAIHPLQIDPKKNEYNFNKFFALAKSIYNSIEQLQLPFRLHIYSIILDSDMKMKLMGEFEHIQLHCNVKNRNNDILDIIEMSRADIFFPAPSSMSMATAILAGPDQIQFITEPQYDAGYPSALLLNREKSILLERRERLKDSKWIESLLGL